jgi:agmatine deiminase
MPPEWAPHRGTWLSWPHRESSWPGIFDRIPPVFVQIVATLVPHEHVYLNVTGPDMEEDVRGRLARAAVPLDRVVFHHFPTDDAWARDHGPIFLQRVVDGRSEEAVLDWEYNSWGGKYPPFDNDNAIPGRIASHHGLRHFTPGLVMEGGSIDVNGAGTLLTTESCLLNPNRNPGHTKADIEQALRDYFNVERILWLGDGIAGDDTDGHVDDLSRFVGPSTIATAIEVDPTDANYHALRNNRERLEAMTDQDGNPLRIVELPMPRPIYHDGERLPASYANFYIANGVVLVPAYDQDSDEIARTVLQQCFPTRRIALIPSTDLAWGLGSFHCVTQQWPA